MRKLRFAHGECCRWQHPPGAKHKQLLAKREAICENHLDALSPPLGETSCAMHDTLTPFWFCFA
jgi:hypothetical protein